jgi:hypothetical protein
MIENYPELDQHVEALRRFLHRDPQARHPLRVIAEIILEILDEDEEGDCGPEQRRRRIES